MLNLFGEHLSKLVSVLGIALFCKFWFAGHLVRFANVCNVRWLPNCPEGQKRVGKNKIFSRHSSQLFYVCLSLSNLVCFFVNLAGNGLAMLSAGLISGSLSV